MKRRYVIITLILAVLAVYVGYKWLFSGQQPSGPMGGAVPVSAAEVVNEKVTEWSEFSGRLRAVEDVEVRPRVSGTIDSVNFKEGDVVKKGETLFTIDLRPYRATYKQAEAALASARARNALAVAEEKRAASLVADRAISKREFDERTAAAREASAGTASAAAALEIAALNLEYAQVRAPVTGIIGRPEITTGNMIEAGPGAPVLTTIQSMNPMYADFEIDEQAYLRAAEKFRGNRAKIQEVPVFLALANEKEFKRKGKIRSFDNQLRTASGTLRVRAEFDNADSTLTPGLFARIRLGSAEQTDAFLVNEQAIGTDQSKKFVYVVQADGTPEHREVKLGPITDGLRIIREGLKPGELVVVNGLQRIHPGAKVTPQKVDMRTLKPLEAPATPQAPESAPQP